MVFFFRKTLQQKDPDLDHSAIRAKHLAIDPTPIGASQERDGGRNVPSVPSRSSGFILTCDRCFLRFSVQEEIRMR